MCSQAQHQTSVWWGLMWPRLKEHRTHRETLGCHARTSREHHRWEARGNEGKAAKMAAHGARWETVALTHAFCLEELRVTARTSVFPGRGSFKQFNVSQHGCPYTATHSVCWKMIQFCLSIYLLWAGNWRNLTYYINILWAKQKKIFNNLKFHKNITLKGIILVNQTIYGV